MWLYETFLYQPLYNALIFLYTVIPGQDIGIAIILLTIFIKLILFPLSSKSLKSQKALQTLQPKLDILRKQHKDDKEKLAQETMKLYKDSKVNPLSSCFPLLIQFPFLIAVYRVFRIGLSNGGFDLLYSFVPNPGVVNTVSLGFINLAERSIPLAILAGLAQYVQTRMLSAKKAPKKVKDGAQDENMMAEVNKSMMYFMPFITVFIGSSFPGGLTLYWFLTTVLTILQQKFIFSRMDNEPNGNIPVNAEKVAAIDVTDKK